MNPRLFRVVWLGLLWAAAPGCRGTVAVAKVIPPSPRASAQLAGLGEKAAAVNAAVDALAPSLGEDLQNAPSEPQAAGLAAAWNALMDAAEQADQALGANKEPAFTNWSRGFRAQPDGPFLRIPADGPDAVESARVVAANVISMRQRRAEVEALFGLIAIADRGFPLSPAMGLQPAACPDGSRAKAPDGGWSAGCSFAFRIEPGTNGQQATALALGMRGPAAGVAFRLIASTTWGEPGIEQIAGRRAALQQLPPKDPANPTVRTPALRSDLLVPAVLEFGEGLTRPRRLSGENPLYTREALEAHVQGLFIAKCFIDPEGYVSDCRVLKPLRLMERAVLDTLVTRRYLPVTYQGAPISCDYVFNIKLMMPGRR